MLFLKFASLSIFYLAVFTFIFESRGRHASKRVKITISESEIQQIYLGSRQRRVYQ